jgi:hypothetical protein
MLQIAWIAWGLLIWGLMLAGVVVTCMDISDTIRGR